MDFTAKKDTPRKRLFILRKYLRLTQDEVSKKCKIPKRSYQRIEYGEMDLTAELIISISKSLGVDSSYFFLPKDVIYSGDSGFNISQRVTEEILSKLLDLTQRTKNLTTNLKSVPASTSNFKNTIFNKALQKEMRVQQSVFLNSQLVDNIQNACLNTYYIAKPQLNLFLLEANLKLDISNSNMKTLCIVRASNNNLDRVEVIALHLRTNYPEGSFSLKDLASKLSNEIGVKVHILLPIL